ncbi:MAG: 2OG-Fe(II) oxygenase [Rheinheimera sp.]|nr:2OG-Fe(II) oxygenase [Rheinheimera sp.]
MSPNELIKQALLCFNQHQLERGTQLIKQAADLGDAAAVLYYGDLLFKENKSAAYTYFEKQFHLGVPGTLHRKALLQFFFDRQKRSAALTDVFSDLQHEVARGDLQSVFALMTLVSEPKHLQYYQHMLHKLLPELARELFLDIDYATVNTQKPTYKALLADFLATTAKYEEFELVHLSSEIDLTLAKNALSALECQYIKLRFTSLLKPSMIVDPKTGVAAQNSYRTGSMVALNPEYLDWILLGIEWKMSAFAKFPREHGEVTNLIHYDSQQRYLPHYDAFVGDKITMQTLLQNGGQRSITVLCYLNSVSSGGETEFPNLGVKVIPRQGDMLMFRNIDANDHVLTGSYHAGLPVISGAKWVLSKWARQAVSDYGRVVYC